MLFRIPTWERATHDLEQELDLLMLVWINNRHKNSGGSGGDGSGGGGDLIYWENIIQKLIR